MYCTTHVCREITVMKCLLIGSTRSNWEWLYNSLYHSLGNTLKANVVAIIIFGLVACLNWKFFDIVRCFL